MFRKNSGIQKFQAKEGEASRFCRIFFLSHRTEKTSPGNHSVFQKIPGREKYFMDERGGGYHDFPSKLLCLTVSKTFVRESYCFWKKFWFQKVKWIKRGVSRFSVETFWSNSAEKFRGHPFNVSENLGYWKKLCIIGRITIFRPKFFVSQCQKTSYRNLLVFH